MASAWSQTRDGKDVRSKPSNAETRLCGHTRVTVQAGLEFQVPLKKNHCRHKAREAGPTGAARRALLGPPPSSPPQGPEPDPLPDPTPRGLRPRAPPLASRNKGFRADFIWITDRSLVCNQGGIHSLLQSHLKNISLYRNLHIDVNRHYFPSIFSPFSLEERKKSHPTR